MTLDMQVMDVFKGDIGYQQFTRELNSELEAALSSLGWAFAYNATSNSAADRKVYGIVKGDLLSGIGYVDKQDNNPIFGKRYYRLRIQVTSPSKENVQNLRDEARLVLNNITARLGILNQPYEEVMAPDHSPPIPINW